MIAGWIRLNRSIENHWIYKDPIKLKWWIDILINVNFKDSKVNIGNQLIECKRGQSIMSLSSWGERWGVSKDKVRNFFLLLEKDGMISHENVSKSTRITVCNYEIYQSDLHDDTTQSKRNPNAIQTQTHPIEESKEEEERKKREEDERLKNKFTRPSVEEVKSYFTENGYSEESAVKAFRYYDVAAWKDSKGNQVRNWKQKMQAVWFKDENRKQQPPKPQMVY